MLFTFLYRRPSIVHVGNTSLALSLAKIAHAAYLHAIMLIDLLKPFCR